MWIELPCKESVGHQMKEYLWAGMCSYLSQRYRLGDSSWRLIEARQLCWIFFSFATQHILIPLSVLNEFSICVCVCVFVCLFDPFQLAHTSDAHMVYIWYKHVHAFFANSLLPPSFRLTFTQHTVLLLLYPTHTHTHEHTHTHSASTCVMFDIVRRAKSSWLCQCVLDWGLHQRSARLWWITV